MLSSHAGRTRDVRRLSPPGVTRDYVAGTTATVTSSAGDAVAHVPSDPGHLSNGAFELPQPLRVSSSPRRLGPAPVSNDPVDSSPSTQRIESTERAAHRRLRPVDPRLHVVHHHAVTAGGEVDEAHRLAIALALAVLCAVPCDRGPRAGTHWVTTWGASTQPDSRRTLTNLTDPPDRPHQRRRAARSACASPTRSAATPPHSGDAYPDSTALRIGSVSSPAKSGTTAAVVPETQTQVTFGGKPTVRISARQRCRQRSGPAERGRRRRPR